MIYFYNPSVYYHSETKLKNLIGSQKGVKYLLYNIQ